MLPALHSFTPSVLQILIYIIIEHFPERNLKPLYMKDHILDRSDRIILLQFFRILMLKDAIMEKMGQSKMEK